MSWNTHTHTTQEDEVIGVFIMFAPLVVAGTFVTIIRYFRTEQFDAGVVVSLIVTIIW
jgi:hypothetical protein